MKYAKNHVNNGNIIIQWMYLAMKREFVYIKLHIIKLLRCLKVCNEVQNMQKLVLNQRNQNWVKI